MYGVIYITLGNLSGNSIAFGLYIMDAAGVTGSDSAVRGLAVMGLTFACILHALWRKGGIILNNLLAFVKVSILLVIIVIGFAASAGASFGNVRTFKTFRICFLVNPKAYWPRKVDGGNQMLTSVPIGFCSREDLQSQSTFFGLQFRYSHFIPSSYSQCCQLCQLVTFYYLHL